MLQYEKQDTPIYNVGILNQSQLEYILSHAKGMGEMWKRIDIVWYSHTGIYWQVTGINDVVYPSVLLQDNYDDQTEIA